MKDAEIVELYWKRSENAIEETKTQFHAYLMKIAMQILGNEEDAKECANDTYLAAWNSMPPNRPERLSAYLGKIMRQTAIDLWRRQNREKRKGSEYALSLEELDEVLSDHHTPEQELDGTLLEQAIGRFLKDLPAKERNLFLGRYYYCDPLKEVAAYCGMKEAKAKSTLFRTRKKLKGFLEKEGFTL